MFNQFKHSQFAGMMSLGKKNVQYFLFFGTTKGI